MTEQWTRWEPIPNLAPKYNINEINFNKKGLNIILMEDELDNNIVEISFKKPIIAYTRTDESFILSLLCNLAKVYGDDFYGKWTFLKVTDSHYIQRISETLRHTISDSSCLMHFVLMAGNDMVDIISDYEPEVSMRTWDVKTLMLLYKDQLLPIIIRYFPTAKIILYGSRSQGKIIKEKYGIDTIKIALDIGQKIDPALMKTLAESLCYEAAVRIPKEVVDLHAVSEELRQQILKEGIDWVKAKDI